MRADHRVKISEGTSTQESDDATVCASPREFASKWPTFCHGRVVLPLGRGIRSLAVFGPPVMTDDTEITIFSSRMPGPRQKGDEPGNGNCDPDDSHFASPEFRMDSVRRSNATVRARRLGLAVLPAWIQASEHDDLSAPLSMLVHHSLCARAVSGRALPRRSSICENVSTTLSA